MELAHNKEKALLEDYAINYFMEDFERETGLKSKVISRQEGPDAVIEVNGTNIGFEITHLYYDRDEAKMLFGRSGSKQHGLERFDIFISELNELINKKAIKSYTYQCEYPISLLIRNGSPIFGLTDFKNAKDYILIPDNNYLNIWFLSRDDNDSRWRLLKLQ
ncbi:MAG: hypothetical protein ACYDEX_15915 [Mobilitalea sp.]